MSHMKSQPYPVLACALTPSRTYGLGDQKTQYLPSLAHQVLLARKGKRPRANTPSFISYQRKPSVRKEAQTPNDSEDLGDERITHWPLTRLHRWQHLVPVTI